MTNCPRLGKLFGGCKFEPRYTLGPSTWRPEMYLGMEAERRAEQYRERKYEGDVCVRCGRCNSAEQDKSR